MKPQLQAISEALAKLQQPENLLQLAVITAAVLLGWWAAKFARARITVSPDPENLPDRLRELLYIGAPPALTLVVLATMDGLLHAAGLAARMVDVAVQLTGLLLFIRVIIYVLRVSLGTRARLKGWGAAITGVIWVFLSLHLLGWGDEVIRVLDGMGMQAGKTRISVWSVMKLLVTVSVFVLLALWVSRWLERRVLKLDALAPTMRIGIAKFVQAFLVGISVLAADWSGPVLLKFIAVTVAATVLSFGIAGWLHRLPGAARIL
jgi:small-conductance mechanosensitive channel